MIVMSLKFGGYKVTEKDIGTMIEKKLESTEDKVPVFTPAPSAVKNEQKNIKCSLALDFELKYWYNL